MSQATDSAARAADRSTLPPRAGLGLKSAHYRQILEESPDIGFFEVHAENYLVDGGPFHHYLSAIRERYPLSIHGVALSIGADEPLDLKHLDAVARLLDRYQPQSFSEHLAWSSHGGIYFNDLLPLPYTRQTLQRVCQHIDQIQTRLGRRMLLENPATYLQFEHLEMEEAEFIWEVVHRSGCHLLLDVNNIYVSSVNHNFDPELYLQALPLDRVGEIHLAGFAEQLDGAGDRLLIDNHGAPVARAVWDLYSAALQCTGAIATLIERDNEVPEFKVLAHEAGLAEERLRAALLRSDGAHPRKAAVAA